MYRISKGSVKKLVDGKSDVEISDSAADAIARALESKARKIAKHAVERAKSKGREVILEEDVTSYMAMHGD